MRVSVELEGNLLSDRFGKYASEADRLEGFPVRSFPIHIEEVPEGAASLALAFIDFDAIPVGGFCWIHWLACDFDPSTTRRCLAHGSHRVHAGRELQLVADGARQLKSRGVQSLLRPSAAR